MKNCDLFINESDYADLCAVNAANHLARALQIPTVSYVDTSKMDFSLWDRLYEFLLASYPCIRENGRWERIGHSILITIDGRNDSLKPALFMAHMDVVPVIPGTESNWRHDPFSGDICDGYIWGRGAMDIKQMLIAIMESAEYLLSHGKCFERTVIIAFGEDEETCSKGAISIVNTLSKRGIQLEYVIDEGAGDVSDASDWGAPGSLICPIGMYEKGYADLRLSVKSQGGHSSNPFKGTSLGKLSRAITAILDNMPPACLSESVKESLALLSDKITEEPIKSWAHFPEAHEQELLSWFTAHESLYHLVKTTAAPTMITPGSPSGNVMPQDMSAVINFRLIPNDTPESLMERFKGIVEPDVELSWVQKISASVPSSLEAYGYSALKKVLEHYFDRLTFIPAQNRGATDARNYESLCRCVMRFGPFLEEEDISAEGIHGTNERISVRAYLQGIRVLTKLMETTCIQIGENDLI